MKSGHPDAVIIGSGASGGVATKVLAEGGLKVLLLEKGDNHFLGLGRAEGILTNRLQIPMDGSTIWRMSIVRTEGCS